MKTLSNNKLKMAFLIYIISFLEWFTTLSIEIIAIRNFTPIVWTNSISTSIILWVILLALSYWYYIWWKNSKNKDISYIKNKIVFNFMIFRVLICEKINYSISTTSKPIESASIEGFLETKIFDLE